MALHKISDFDLDYRDTIQGNDLKGMEVYSQATNEKIGTVSDVVVDDEGKFRYLIVDIGFWIFGKTVLLPFGRARIDSKADRVYIGLTREQAENLPEYKEGMPLDYDYEERVRGIYRTPNMAAPVDLTSTTASTTPTYDRNSYNYVQDADLYNLDSNEDRTFKLYEERLVANKQRRKAGEVTIAKHVETETARVVVPVQKERIVLERVTPKNAGVIAYPDSNAFQSGEVAHMEVYEEVPDIHKEAFVREEIRLKKVVEQETVEAQETIRREEVDIDSSGRSIINEM